MTLKEKVGQMTQLEIGMVTDGKDAGLHINPAKLRKPALEQPVVGGEPEQVGRVFADERAGICADKFNIVLDKPLLDLIERMAMLFRMLILIAEPRVASSWFVLSIAQYRIERDRPII